MNFNHILGTISSDFTNYVEILKNEDRLILKILSTILSNIFDTSYSKIVYMLSPFILLL